MNTIAFENLFEFKNNDISLLKILLIFYLIIGSGYIKELYSGQMKDFLQNSRCAQHIIGFTTLMVIINLFAKVNDASNVFFYSVLGYMFFILSTKLDLHWNLMIIFLLIIVYFIENKFTQQSLEINYNKHLSEDEKNKIINDNKFIKNTIYIFIIIINLAGLFCYINKKKNQYGGNFNLDKFLFNARNIKNK
jgi:hypothetical protein